jgi:hypothetical protein
MWLWNHSLVPALVLPNIPARYGRNRHGQTTRLLGGLCLSTCQPPCLVYREGLIMELMKTLDAWVGTRNGCGFSRAVFCAASVILPRGTCVQVALSSLGRASELTALTLDLDKSGRRGCGNSTGTSFEVTREVSSACSWALLEFV